MKLMQNAEDEIQTREGMCYSSGNKEISVVKCYRNNVVQQSFATTKKKQDIVSYGTFQQDLQVKCEEKLFPAKKFKFLRWEKHSYFPIHLKARFLIRSKYIYLIGLGVVVVMIAWQLDLQLHMQSVPITTNVVSSNPTQARCTQYTIMG